MGFEILSHSQTVRETTNDFTSFLLRIRLVQVVLQGRVVQSWVKVTEG